MDFKEFSEEVLKEVTDRAGGAFSIRIVEKLKNNGVKKTAIAATDPGRKGGLSIYLEEFYEEYKKDSMEISEAAEKVCQKLAEHMDDLEDVRLDSFWEWEAMESQIYAEFINYERNKELLEGKPYRKLLDLAVVYRIKVEGLKDGGIGNFLVNDKYMEAWGQTEESLYQSAVSNMRLSGEPIFEGMEEILRQMMPEARFPFPDSEPSARMYVLTNQEKIFGAVELLDGNTLKKIGEELGGDFIVLPSSLHECVIIPADEAASYQELADMVAGINKDVVPMEERLSDHVYLYDQREGALRIAA